MTLSGPVSNMPSQVSGLPTHLARKSLRTLPEIAGADPLGGRGRARGGVVGKRKWLSECWGVEGARPFARWGWVFIRLSFFRRRVLLPRQTLSPSQRRLWLE